MSSENVGAGELKKKISDLEMELGQLKNEREDIQRKMTYAENLANALSVELAREKNDKRSIADRSNKINEENLSLRAQIKELTSSKMVLERSMARLTEDKHAMEKKLDEAQSVIQNRIDEVLEIKSSIDKRLTPNVAMGGAKEIELPPIIVSAPAASKSGAAKAGGPPGTSGLEGRVISINDENNFVIVDLGENSGIRVGDTLSVYRGSKYVAALDVIQVRKDISAADIKQKGAKIKVGDVVR